MSQASTKAVDLDRILATAQLPALPQSAIRLLELSKDERNGPAEFAVPIEADPGLTGQVLKFVNSSYFGFAREISSVKLAITMVGIRTIKNFALWSAVFSIMPNPKCGPFELKSLWQDSLRRGLLARALCKLLGAKETEEAFAAALLQDLAIPLLARELPDDYLELLTARNEGRVRLSALEQQRFGWTHADVAGRLLRRWNLPEEFASAAQSHASLDPLLARDAAPPLALCVAVAALLPATVDDLWHEAALFDKYYEQLRPGGAPTAVELLEQIDRDYTEFAPVLQLAQTGLSLADRHREAAEIGLAVA